MAKFDRATAKRMGYKNIIAAETIKTHGVLTEICLMGSGNGYGKGYHLAVHWDCNPDSPNEGSSELDSNCAETRDAALACFDRRVAELSAPPPAPGR